MFTCVSNLIPFEKFGARELELKFGSEKPGYYVILNDYLPFPRSELQILLHP